MSASASGPLHAAAAGLFLMLPFLAHAQTSSSPTTEQVSPAFVVTEFSIEGPELVPRAEVKAVLKAFEGRPITFEELRQATVAVEALHAAKGFEVVRVLIPEQEVAPGQSLVLQVVDARLDVVTVAGNDFFPSESILRGLTVLKPGALINTRDMDRNLRLINDNSSRVVRVSLEPSDKPGLVDAKVNVADQDVLLKYITLDNTGTNATGDFRLGLALQHNNVFGRDHMATFQFITSPGHWSDVEVYALNYKIPFYQQDSLLELAFTDANVNAGNLGLGGTTVSVQGAGTTAAIRWTHLLDRLAGMDQRVTVSQEYKQFVSQVQLNGTGASLVPNLESRPTGVSYSLVDTDEGATGSLQVAYYKNLVTGGDNSTAQYALANPAAKADFDLFKFSANWSRQVLGNWRFTAQLDGQYSGDALISGEQFGAGGIYSVRGFEERVISGDSGLRQSLELLGPDFSKRISPLFERLQPVLFAEAAQLRLQQAPNNGRSEPYISSFGAGLRFAFAPRQQIRLDLARVVSGVPIQPHGDMMLHFSFASAL